MENKQKLATEKQWNLYSRLAAAAEKALDQQAFGQLTSFQASKLISALLRQEQNPDSEASPAEFNVQRLGMCFKQMQDTYTARGKDVLGEHRKAFKDDVVHLYGLASEIEHELTANAGGAQ